MESFVKWFLGDFVVWGIIGIIGWQMVLAIKDSKIGTVFTLLGLGLVGYYFAKNPTEVLNMLANIASKFKIN